MKQTRQIKQKSQNLLTSHQTCSNPQSEQSSENQQYNFIIKSLQHLNCQQHKTTTTSTSSSFVTQGVQTTDKRAENINTKNYYQQQIQKLKKQLKKSTHSSNNDGMNKDNEQQLLSNKRSLIMLEDAASNRIRSRHSPIDNFMRDKTYQEQQHNKSNDRECLPSIVQYSISISKPSLQIPLKNEIVQSARTIEKIESLTYRDNKQSLNTAYKYAHSPIDSYRSQLNKYKEKIQMNKRLRKARSQAKLHSISQNEDIKTVLNLQDNTSINDQNQIQGLQIDGNNLPHLNSKDTVNQNTSQSPHKDIFKNHKIRSHRLEKIEQFYTNHQQQSRGCQSRNRGLPVLSQSQQSSHRKLASIQSFKSLNSDLKMMQHEQSLRSIQQEYSDNDIIGQSHLRNQITPPLDPTKSCFIQKIQLSADRHQTSRFKPQHSSDHKKQYCQIPKSKMQDFQSQLSQEQDECINSSNQKDLNVYQDAYFDNFENFQNNQFTRSPSKLRVKLPSLDNYINSTSQNNNKLGGDLLQLQNKTERLIQSKVQINQLNKSSSRKKIRPLSKQQPKFQSKFNRKNELIQNEQLEEWPYNNYGNMQYTTTSNMNINISVKEEYDDDNINDTYINILPQQ